MSAAIVYSCAEVDSDPRSSLPPPQPSTATATTIAAAAASLSQQQAQLLSSSPSHATPSNTTTPPVSAGENTFDSYSFLSRFDRYRNYRSRYSLVVRQQPVQARQSGGREKDRRPIDPPPIVQLVNLDNSSDDIYLQNPYLFVYVSLIAPSIEAHNNGASNSPEDSSSVGSENTRRLSPLSNGVGTIANDTELRTLPIISKGLCGQLVSSLHRLKDITNEDAGFFIFPDTSARLEGVYRLRFSLYEIRGAQSVRLCSVHSDAFTVYPPRSFPGMSESTFLSRSFSDQGVRIRIRKESRYTTRTSMKRSASAITLVTQLPISHTTDGMSLNKRRMLEMNASPSPSLAGPRHGAYMPREGDYPHPPPPSHHSHSAATAAVTAPNMHLSYSPPHYQSTPPNYPVPPTAHAHYSSSSAHPRYPHTQQPLPPSHYYEANTSPATHHMSHAPRSHEHVYSGYASVEEMNNDRYGPAVTSAPIATNMDGSNYPRLTSMPAVNAMPTTGPGYISPRSHNSQHYAAKSAAVMAHGYSISSSHQHHAIHQRQQQQHQQHPSHMPHGSPKSYYYPHPADSAAAYAHIRSANACGDPHCQNPHCGVTSVKPANPSEIYRPSSIPVSTPAAHMYTSRASDGPTTYHYPSASSALSAHPSSAIAANTRLPTPSSLSSPTTSASYPNGAGGPPLPPSSSTHHLDGYRANHSHGNAIYDNRMPQPLSSPYGQHRVASASSHGSYGHPHAYTPTTPISNTMTSIPASAPAISRTHTVFKHSDPRTANASHFYTMANTASTIPCRSQTPSNTNNH